MPLGSQLVAVTLANARPTASMPEPSTIPKQLILHVGIHKTGTTAIQTGLARHAEFLQRRGYSQAVLHWDLPYLHEAFNPKECGKTREDIDLLSARNRFREWALQQTCEKIILSGEAMTLFLWEGRGCDDDVGRTLLGGFADTTVVLYLRRQDRFIESAYGQLVMNGLADSFEQFGQAQETDMFRILDWHEKVVHLRSLLPDAKILVKLYEHAIEGGDIFRDFLQSIGIEAIPDAIATSRENQSLGWPQIALVRLCNQHRDAEHRQALIQALRTTDLPPRFNALDLPRLRAQDRSRLLEHYHESNARLFAEHDLGDLGQWEQIDASDERVDDQPIETDEKASLEIIDRLCARAFDGD